MPTNCGNANYRLPEYGHSNIVRLPDFHHADVFRQTSYPTKKKKKTISGKSAHELGLYRNEIKTIHVQVGISHYARQHDMPAPWRWRAPQPKCGNLEVDDARGLTVMTWTSGFPGRAVTVLHVGETFDAFHKQGKNTTNKCVPESHSLIFQQCFLPRTETPYFEWANVSCNVFFYQWLRGSFHDDDKDFPRDYIPSTYLA